ncbi:MAG: hypothetical protein ACKVS8_11125 [Phycisphaerales bacterium]
MNSIARTRPAASLAAAALLIAATSAAAAQTWSIKNDWSDVNNPTGPWSLRSSNGALLPFTLRTTNWVTPQPSWGGFPTWFKSNGTETVGHDWIAGDIVTHSGPAGDGANQGLIRWTSPVEGAVNITGNLWWGGVADQFFRANDWFLQLNGISFTGQIGTVGSGSGRGRGNPIDFSEGSGGISAITSVPVHIGDEIRLLVRTNANSFGGNGAYTGVNFDIVAVPTPGAAALLSLAGMAATRRRRGGTPD